MGKRSTTKGYWRAHGGTEASASSRTGPSPAVLPLMLAVPVDPTAADGTPTGFYLPSGAIVLGIDVVSGHTGGTTPLLNIGLDDGVTPDVDGLLNGAAADADLSINVATATTPGVSFGVALTQDWQVTAGTGGGTPGTGTSIAYISYTMEDDGKVND